MFIVVVIKTLRKPEYKLSFILAHVSHQLFSPTSSVLVAVFPAEVHFEFVDLFDSFETFFMFFFWGEIFGFWLVIL